MLPTHVHRLARIAVGAHSGHEKAAGGCGADTDHGAARAEYGPPAPARKTLAACEVVNTRNSKVPALLTVGAYHRKRVERTQPAAAFQAA